MLIPVFFFGCFLGLIGCGIAYLSSGVRYTRNRKR